MARHEVDINFGIDGMEKFRNVQKELTQANRQLPRDFKNSVNEVARGVRDLAKAKALEGSIAGKTHTGLHAEVAAGVQIVQVPGGVRVVTSVADSEKAAIPRGMDPEVARVQADGVRGWRHPTFGNKNNWQAQKAEPDSWFMESMRSGAEPLRNRLINNINDAAERIARLGD